MCLCMQEDDGSALWGADPDNLLSFWRENRCSDMEPVGQAFEFQETSGHVPVFDHVYEVSPVAHVFTEAILS
eukprot:9982077-Prorocentrum_lima.AAC.1